jgi:division protein CdvB (Snf7/Vps24/ESCRT-III family)
MRKVKKWRQSIRTQDRELDKSLRSIASEEVKTQRLIKQSAKRNDAASCKLLALELVRARKQKDRIHTSKAQLNSLVLVMTQQLATLKVAGAFEKSGEVMGLVNKLVRLPEVSATMMELSKEMVKVCHCIALCLNVNGWVDVSMHLDGLKNAPVICTTYIQAPISLICHEKKGRNDG